MLHCRNAERIHGRQRLETTGLKDLNIVDTRLFFNLQYRYATGFDWLLIIIGTLSAGVDGAALPVMFLFFGELTTQFTVYGRYLQCNLNYDVCFSMGLTNVSERLGPCTVLFNVAYVCLVPVKLFGLALTQHERKRANRIRYCMAFNLC